MGYYVEIVGSRIFIKKEDQEDAYQAMVELNNFDEKKSGGSFPAGPRPENLHYHPYKWFSWLDPDYPDHLEDFNSILRALGFWPKYDDKGNLTSIGYNDKNGDEEVFFEAIAPYISDGSYIQWRGEDNTEWTWEFSNGKMSPA